MGRGLLGARADHVRPPRRSTPARRLAAGVGRRARRLRSLRGAGGRSALLLRPRGRAHHARRHLARRPRDRPPGARPRGVRRRAAG